MSERLSPDRRASAVEQVRQILSSEGAPISPDFSGGYVDVLGRDDALGPHIGQRAFHSRALALIYERLWRPGAARLFFGARMGEAKERNTLVDMLDLGRGERILDVGCGPGNHTRPLARIAGQGLTVGIDASVPMLSRAVKKGGGPNLAYARGDAAALPFVEHSFDVAFCVGVLHLVENPMAALDEMTRVLAPGGRLAIMTTCRKEGSARSRGGVLMFRKSEITDALSERGFVDVQQHIVKRGQFVAGRLSPSTT